jgi:CHRD domain-containing protein
MTSMRLVSIGLVLLVTLLVTLGVLIPGPVSSREEHGVKFFRAILQGVEEVPATSTRASGRFRVEISEDGSSMTYTLNYSNLEGEIRQAHIHFAQKGVNGAIVVFLCQTSFNPDPTGHAPTCPQSGTVTGTLTAANMTALAVAQGIAPGEFAELVRAMRAGVTYANVHSAGTGVPTNFAGGEIRGQIGEHGDDD